MSYQNLSRQLDLSAAYFLARLVGVYTLTADDVDPFEGDYPDMEEGTNLYSFVEQTYSAVTGLPVDATPGRQTSNEFGLVGDQTEPVTTAPLSMFAMEDSNAFMSIPGETPTGYVNPGPYVEMRLRGVVNGVAVYEFNTSAEPGEWVFVTSTDPQTIYFGSSITANLAIGTTTLTVASGSLTSANVGQTLIGTGIPGRTLYDAAFTNGSNGITSLAGNFSSLDVGQPVVGGPVNFGTTISSITSGTLAVMSANAFSTETNVKVNIGNATTILSVTAGTPTTAQMSQSALANEAGTGVLATTGNCAGYSAVIQTPSTTEGVCAWTTGAAVWFEEVNSRVPNTERYQCRLLETDANGVQIWATRFYEKICPPVTLGPFLTSVSCVANQLSFGFGYICIPANGDVCDAFVSNDACGTVSPPPAPPPCPPPLTPYYDFGSLW